jgi:serine acetyltransferase/GT2 family glycosyltransferase
MLSADDRNEAIGVVVIGRNEGERLRRCLVSLADFAPATIYVDSGSTDGSRELASMLGVRVHTLDQVRPFNAARARQEGFEALLAASPALRFVFFVDGDCQIVADWPALGLEAMLARQDAAVVCGRLREFHPEQSVFNRISELEWAAPVGEAESCGGIAIMRVAAYRQVGGFDPSVLAGEEPELCHRLRKAGWKILRLDSEMALHDAAITRLGQWWGRAVRTGYGALDVEQRLGVSEFSRLNRSVRRWAVGWPAGVAVLGLVAGLVAGPTAAMAGVIFGALALPAQMLRVAWRGYRGGLRLADSAAYGVLTMLDKWPQWWGQLRLWRDLRAGNAGHKLENKVATKVSTSDWAADLACYPPRPFLKEQSIWVIAVYRYGHRVDAMPHGLHKRLALTLYWALFRLVETTTGISLPKEAAIGPGLRIFHFGNIFLHPDVVIGARCTLRQGVTIGNIVANGPVPVLGDDVEVGAYAQILGGVRVGNGAKIGSMSVVLHDVPEGCTVAGIPARVVRSPTNTESTALDGSAGPNASKLAVDEAGQADV